MQKQTAQGIRPGFSFLVCPDGELIRDELETMLAQYPPANGQWQKHVFWGDEEPDNKYWETLGRSDLFSAGKLVVVRNAQNWNAQIWKSISSALSHGQDNVWPVFCLEVEFEKGKFKIPAHIQKTRCLSFAEKKGWIWRNSSLAHAQNLQNYARKQASLLGLDFEKDAFDLFCASVMRDARAVKNELEKLALTTTDGKITPDNILIDPGNPETNAFACIKYIQSGEIALVWQEVAKGNASGLLFSLVALLAREFRLFWAFCAGEDVHTYDEANKRKLAQGLGIGGIARGFRTLADAEWTVKSGNQTPEQALEFLCVEMTRIFKSAKPGYS